MPTLNHIADSPYFAGLIAPPKNIRGVRQFNPAICDWQGVRWIAWRVEHKDGTSSIALGQLVIRHSSFVIEHASVCDIPGFVEDPRLLVVDDHLLLQVARVIRTEDDTRVVQEFHRISPKGITTGPIAPAFFGNGLKGRITKNWTAFEHNRRLHIHHWPGENLVADCTGTYAELHQGEVFRYPFGTLSGRTPAVQLPSHGGGAAPPYLAIAGGRTPHPSRACSRYYLTAWTFSAEAPFAMQRVSARPILWAAEHDERKVHPSNPHYSDRCIYPAGMILESSAELHSAGSLLVSCGVNDTFMVLLRIPLSSLQLVPLDHPFELRDLWQPGCKIPAGAVPVRVRAHSLAEDGTHWNAGDCFLTTPLRARALGDTVEVIRMKEAA